MEPIAETEGLMPRPSLGGDRRDQIRAVSAHLFFEHGYQATTMRQIAEALELKPGSLYHHFPDKEEILFDLVASVLDQLTQGAEQLMSQESEHRLKLAALVINHVVLHAVGPNGPVLGDSELRSLTGERRSKTVAARDAYKQLVVSVLRGGGLDGRFRLLDANLTAFALIAQGSALGTWYREPGRLKLEQVAASHVGLAMRAVEADRVPDVEVRRLYEAARAVHDIRADRVH